MLEQLPYRNVSGDNTLERFGNVVFGGFALVGLVAVAGLIYTIVTKFILSGTGVVFGVVMTLLLIFAVLGLVYVVLNEGRKGRRSREITVPAELESAETAKLLRPGEFTQMPTVVEDTTELLKAEVNRERSE